MPSGRLAALCWAAGLLFACSGGSSRAVELPCSGQWCALWVETEGAEATYIIDGTEPIPDELQAQLSYSVSNDARVSIAVADYDVAMDEWGIAPGRLDEEAGGRPFPLPDRAWSRGDTIDQSTGWITSDGLPPGIADVRSPHLPSACPRIHEWPFVAGPTLTSTHGDGTFTFFRSVSFGVGQVAFTAVPGGMPPDGTPRMWFADFEAGTTSWVPVPAFSGDIVFDAERNSIWGMSVGAVDYALPGILRVDLQTQAIVDAIAIPDEVIAELPESAGVDARDIEVLTDAGEVLLLFRGGLLLRYDLGADTWTFLDRGSGSVDPVFGPSWKLAKVSETELVYSASEGGLRSYVAGGQPSQAVLVEAGPGTVFPSKRFGPLFLNPNALRYREPESGEWMVLASKGNETFPIAGFRAALELPDGALVMTDRYGEREGLNLTKALYRRSVCVPGDEGNIPFQLEGHAVVPVHVAPAQDGVFIVTEEQGSYGTYLFRSPAGR